MQIEYEKEAAKHISKMDKPAKLRIKRAIEKLPSGDVVKLQGQKGDYRLRVGDDKLSKEMLKGLIDLIDDSDTDTIFKVLVRFVPEEAPLPDEIEAINRADESIARYGTVPHESINWD